MANKILNDFFFVHKKNNGVIDWATVITYIITRLSFDIKKTFYLLLREETLLSLVHFLIKLTISVIINVKHLKLPAILKFVT